jgi:hypothetical protein
MNRLDELLLLWQDQSITDPELTELKGLLTCPEGQARAAEEFFLTGVVLEAVRAQSAAGKLAFEGDDGPIPAAVPLASGHRSPSRRWKIWLSGAAALVLLILGATHWLRSLRPPTDSGEAPVFAQLEQVQGATFVVNNHQRLPAQVGQVLVRGQGIATQGEASEAVVQMEDAVRLKLGGDTTVFTATTAEETTGGPNLVLEHGELLVEVTRSLGKKRMAVQTPLGLATAEAENTALHVSDAAGVVVVRGEVSFVHKATGKSIRVNGGEYVVATPNGEMHTAHLFSGDAYVWATFPPGFTDNVAVAFSSDSRMLAAATHSRDATGIRLGPVDGPQPPLDLSGDRYTAFAPDGKLLAAGEGHKVLLYDTATGKPERVLEKKGPRVRISSLAFSPDGRLLAVGKGTRDTAGDIELWDVKTGDLLWSARGHAGGVTSLAFAPDGKLLASGSWDKTVLIWEPAARQEKTRILTIPALVVRSLAFAPDGRTLAIATGPGDPRVREPGEIKLWDVATETMRANLRGHSRTVTSLAYAADGQTLVSASADTTVRFWDLATNREYGMLKGHKAAIGFEGLAVALSPNGAWLATISFDHTVKLWKVTWLRKTDRPSHTRARNPTRGVWLG